MNILSLPTMFVNPELRVAEAIATETAAVTKAGYTNAELVQRPATFVDSYVPAGKNAGATGTLKHEAATKCLRRYQKFYGDRGLDFKVRRGDTILDVLDNTNSVIYDWKFGYQGGKQFRNSIVLLR
ncbi:hypothetical protein LZZ85_24360 [Terrimonas sp. NA20]|uniref:Uncharacterized protein n=1 Tax=Terrimonas ginsenosidimutans TaxID=2908004 RepID=A0ABS9KZ15_9BACT|nr:hypothetical protein [Terrimonas ginsenosidimutans]MCG2617454.1 hypothetical protein [Terrimonas ginsenosidimutans]